MRNRHDVQTEGEKIWVWLGRRRRARHKCRGRRGGIDRNGENDTYNIIDENSLLANPFFACFVEPVVICACGIAAAILACSAASSRTWSLELVAEPPFCECVRSDLPPAPLDLGGRSEPRAAEEGDETSTYETPFVPPRTTLDDVDEGEDARVGGFEARGKGGIDGTARVGFGASLTRSRPPLEMGLALRWWWWWWIVGGGMRRSSVGMARH